MSTMGDDMLFPDFSRRLYRGVRWTATEDCFIVGCDYVLSEDTPPKLTIDGVVIDITAERKSYFAFCVAKGSVIKFEGGFTAYGLKKGGG